MNRCIVAIKAFGDHPKPVISNYLDFEKEILSIPADHMVRARWDYIDLFDLSLNMNIKVVNLLTSARLYIDQLAMNANKAALAPGDNIKLLNKVCFQKSMTAIETIDFWRL